MSVKRELAIPTTLDEAITILKDYMTEEERAFFKNIEEDTAALGDAGIRNNWQLWRQNPITEHFHQLGIKHPGDISAIILTCLHRTLNNKPLQLDALIKKHQAIRSCGIFEDQR